MIIVKLDCVEIKLDSEITGVATVIEQKELDKERLKSAVKHIEGEHGRRGYR